MQTALHALLLAAAHVAAYIPASPTNDTSAVSQTDMSLLTMRWAPAGTYSRSIAFQRVAPGSAGFDQGALVHFSEAGLAADQTTATPWIALVSCDTNATDASQALDIFAIARARGAVAALLYSATSETCFLHPEATNNTAQNLDISVTQSKAAALIMNAQFSNLKNASFATFDAAQLNGSADAIVAALNNTSMETPFLLATLRAANSSSGTGTGNGTGTSPGSGSGSGAKPSRNIPHASLALFILYAMYTFC